MTLMEDNDLVSYWEDLPRPPPPPPLPQEPVTVGVLWLGLANGDIEIATDWYSRIPVHIQPSEDRLLFRGTWQKPVGAPATMNRLGLWSTRTNGELVYWKDVDPVILTATDGMEITLTIQDNPMGQPVSFRRMLKKMGLL